MSLQGRGLVRPLAIPLFNWVVDMCLVRYFDIELDGKKYANAIWYYPYPIAESAAVAGRFAFDSSQDGVALEVNFHA